VVAAAGLALDELVAAGAELLPPDDEPLEELSDEEDEVDEVDDSALAGAVEDAASLGRLSFR